MLVARNKLVFLIDIFKISGNLIAIGLPVQMLNFFLFGSG
jgi:hypothetical protein